MAIEIVPKPKAKPKRTVNLLFYFSLIIFILTIAAYFGLNFLKEKKNQELEDLKSRLAEQETEKMQELKESLIKDEKKINDFSALLNSHRYSTDFFKFLEGITHSKVMWSNINLNLLEAKMTIHGQADSFKTLTQQLLVLERDPRVKDLDLGGLSLIKGGGVSFNLELSLSPELFKYK